MPTNPQGDNVSKTVSMQTAMWKAAEARQKALGFRSYSAYVQSLLRKDLAERPDHVMREEKTYPPHTPRPTVLGDDKANSSVRPGSPADSDDTRGEHALVEEAQAAEQAHQANLKPDLAGYAKRRRAVRGAKKK